MVSITRMKSILPVLEDSNGIFFGTDDQQVTLIIKYSGFLPSGVFCDVSIGLILIPKELSIKGKLVDISMFMLLAVL